LNFFENSENNRISVKGALSGFLGPASGSCLKGVPYHHPTLKFSSVYGKLEKFDLISILGCNSSEIFFKMHVMNFQTKSWRNFELSNAVNFFNS
jgi:hypothetical protein